MTLRRNFKEFFESHEWKYLSEMFTQEMSGHLAILESSSDILEVRFSQGFISACKTLLKLQNLLLEGPDEILDQSDAEEEDEDG